MVEHSTADGESKGSNPATGTGREKITKRCFEKASGSSKVVDRSNTDLESEGSNPSSHILAAENMAEKQDGSKNVWLVPRLDSRKTLFYCFGNNQLGIKNTAST